MKKVSVIGCPGAGKTEFSRRLSQLARLPLIHLDLLYHDQRFQYQSDKESWCEAVRELVKRKSWLIDGNYKSTFDIRLPVSDTIIFLDYPTYVSAWRAIKRRVRFHKKVREDMPDTWEEKLGWDFFWFIVRFNRNVAKDMRVRLSQYQEGKEVLIFKKPTQAEQFLQSLEKRNYSST